MDTINDILPLCPPVTADFTQHGSPTGSLYPSSSPYIFNSYLTIIGSGNTYITFLWGNGLGMGNGQRFVNSPYYVADDELNFNIVKWQILL